jgi:hypothetical protein
MDRLSQTMLRWWQNGNIVFANGILLMHKIKQMFGGLLKQVLLPTPVVPNCLFMAYENGLDSKVLSAREVVVHALAAIAVREGFQIVENCAVRMLDISAAGRIVGVITEAGWIAAPEVVLAGGVSSCAVTVSASRALPMAADAPWAKCLSVLPYSTAGPSAKDGDKSYATSQANACGQSNLNLRGLGEVFLAQTSSFEQTLAEGRRWRRQC